MKFRDSIEAQACLAAYSAGAEHHAREYAQCGYGPVMSAIADVNKRQWEECLAIVAAAKAYLADKMGKAS